MSTIDRVLIVGGTGRTGRHAVAAAEERGLTAVVLARNEARARATLSTAEIAVGDLTDPATLRDAVANVEGIIFVHGSDNDGGDYERIDYGGVANILEALGDRRPRIVLMTTFFVTHRDHYFNSGGHALDWKRRSERLVRASGAPYTVVRPGWLDNAGGAHLDVRQGDAHEGGITRARLGAFLVEALLDESAIGRTVEVFEEAAGTSDANDPFAGIQADAPGALDGAHDPDNLPLDAEPEQVRAMLFSLHS